jgi:hypothetical protein
MRMSLAELNVSSAVFAAFGGLHLATERVSDPLHAVAYSQNRDVEFQYAGVALGGVLIVDGAGAAGKDDPGGGIGANFVYRCGAREDGGEDLLLADATGDELGVLAAEIEDDDAAAFGLRFW